MEVKLAGNCIQETGDYSRSTKKQKKTRTRIIRTRNNSNNNNKKRKILKGEGWSYQTGHLPSISFLILPSLFFIAANASFVRDSVLSSVFFTASIHTANESRLFWCPCHTLSQPFLSCCRLPSPLHTQYSPISPLDVSSAFPSPVLQSSVHAYYSINNLLSL